jgi:hypothetical protein
MNLGPADLDLLRDADWHRRSELLARRICERLGQEPRELPSPFGLAVERWARPAIIAAAAALVLSLASSRLWQRVPAMPADSILDLLAVDQPPSAAEVYSLLRGYSLGASRRDNRP